MNKYILVILCLITLTAFTQSKFKPVLRVGVNNSSITKITSNNGMAYFLGLAYPVKISSNKSMQIELVYESLVTKTKESSNKIKIDFVTATLNFNILKKNKFNALGGTFVSVLTSQNFSQYSPGFIDLTPNLDAGLFLGIGYNILPNLNSDLRYKIGFIDVINMRDDIYNNQTRMLQLGINYKFN